MRNCQYAYLSSNLQGMIKIKKKKYISLSCTQSYVLHAQSKDCSKRKKKLDFTYLCRYHSLAEEPTEKKKKESQALQQANFTLIFPILILYPLGVIPVASLGWGLLCCTYIPMCLCDSLSFLGEGGGWFFFQILFLKRNKCIHLFVKTPLLFVQLLYINNT